MEPSLDLQKAIRNRLIASPVTALVAAAAILDKNIRPEVFPCIIIGEGQTLPDDGISRNRHQVYSDLHLWTKEAGLVAVKQIAGAIRDALADGRLALDHHHVADLMIASTRFLRDPSGASHGVMTLQARLVELA